MSADYQVGDRVRCGRYWGRVLQVDRRTLLVLEQPWCVDEVRWFVDCIDEHLPLTAEEIRLAFLKYSYKIPMNNEGYTLARRLIAEGLHVPYHMVHVEPDGHSRVRIRLGTRWL